MTTLPSSASASDTLTLAMDCLHRLLAFAVDSRAKFSLWLIPLFLLADALLSTMVVLFVPYTEIDWAAYMQQITQYLGGERDYALIEGCTGPLVYPAGHIYIYSFLYRITEQGTNILRAQWLFVGLYLATLGVVLLCYREARAPPYILPLLALSKRLHSIYMLRLFNDPFSIFFLFIAVLMWQKRMWTRGSILYSLSISVKMSTLLVLPAVGAVLLQAVGRNKALQQAMIMLLIQFLLSAPFSLTYPRSYLSRAFELTRQFYYSQTVNWRFVKQDIFLSKEFSLGLLAANALILLLFMIFKWKRPSHRNFLGFISLILSPPTGLEERQISSRVTPRFILCSIMSANTIGMLCARSLHFQFYSWLAWGTPYVLWQSGLGPLWIFPIWAAQEWAWNVYPSTSLSSRVVVGALGLSVIGLLWGVREVEGPIEERRVVEVEKKRS